GYMAEWHGGDAAPDGRAAGRSEQAVLNVNQSVYDAIESGDIDLMESLWADRDDVICIHPGAEPLRGRAAVSRSWSMVMANTGYIQFFLTGVNVDFAHHQTAVVTCTENVLAEGETADSFSGGKAVATNVFVRAERGWLLWMRHASPVAIAEEG